MYLCGLLGSVCLLGLFLISGALEVTQRQSGYESTAEVLCTVTDLEQDAQSRIPRTREWVIAQRCQMLSFAEFPYSESMVDDKGNRFEAKHLLQKIIKSAELSFGTDAMIKRLKLSRCGIHDEDIPLLVREYVE